MRVDGEGASMNQISFEAVVVRTEGILLDVIRERTYGGVRVTAQWPADLTSRELRVIVDVHGDIEPCDAPAYAELFFHDVFLLLNLASPRSFGGTISIRGGELRARELVLDPRVFEYAHVAERLPLETVVAWYDRLGLGTRQLASDSVSTALFQLLQLSRAEDDEEVSILRLAGAADALLGRPESLRRLFELREAIANGRAPVFHPLHDDALDPHVEDATREWIEVADLAASAVIGALQQQIRNA
jgi:hypothetical protein